MSNKPRANQISLTSTGFSKNLSINDNDLQKAFNTIDQLTAGSGTSIHNSLLGIQGGSNSDGYYHFTNAQHTWLLDGYNTGKWSALKGGTGLSSYSSGDILYSSATNTLSKLPKSTDGYYLQLSSGLPSWLSVSNASINLGRDLSGTTNDAYVKGFNGIGLTNNTPNDAYVYAYNAFLNKWTPSKINNSSIITVGKQDLLIANATNYLLSNFTESTDENAIAFLAPIVGILSNLVCYCATAPGGSETVVITVRKNTVDTTITGTITGAGTTATDITHTASLASGDKITFKVVTSLNCVARDLFVSLIFKM